MKKNQLVKFSLSVVCAAVLAACSSSSGDDGAAAAAAQQKAQAEQQAAAKAAAEKAAAEKAAAEKAAAEKAAADKALAEAAAKAAAAAKDNNRQGVKFVKKSQSDFEIGLNETSRTSTSQGNQSDMTVKLHRSLDTVVVATNTANTKSTDKVGYLEDYDFRKADQATLDKARAEGKTTLSHIHLNSTAQTARTQVQGNKLVANGATAIEAEAIRIRNNTEDTKTKTMGTQTGNALVYQTGRTNYIGTDEKVVGNNTGLAAHTNKDFRDRSNTVTEVYGHRTFVVGNAETGVDVAVDAKANAPFQALNGDKAKGTYVAGTLNKVQYGRVTSRLDVENSGTTGVKTGIATQSNAKGTLVTQYGTYNAQGTENNYFYRGVDATAPNANLTANLAKAYGQVGNANVNAGSLTYQGHAVTYGFEHKAPAVDLPDVGRVPNAVYGNVDYEKPALVSGTHATANIDLATRNVTGSLYDVWEIGGNKYAQDIATFKGTLANSGEIDGTSTRVQDKAAGSFTANLYGTKAEELGGGVASNATEANKSWGAVFGAQIQNPAYATSAAPAAPAAPKSPWSVQTDEANK